MKTHALVALLASFAAIGGCATTSSAPVSTSQQLQVYLDNAGPPVESFSYFGGFEGWRAVGDQALVVYTGENKAWLLGFNFPCEGLQFAINIGVTGSMDQVEAGFDSVVVANQGLQLPQTCTINSIRPVNIAGVNAEKAELRQITIQERAADRKGGKPKGHHGHGDRKDKGPKKE